MKSFIVFSVLALVATVNGDCQPECLEGCKGAILPSAGVKCTMLFGYGQDAGGWFQTDSDPTGRPTCQESCDKTCEFMCNNGGIPPALSGPLKKRLDKSRFICGGICVAAAPAIGGALSSFFG